MLSLFSRQGRNNFENLILLTPFISQNSQLNVAFLRTNQRISTAEQDRLNFHVCNCTCGRRNMLKLSYQMLVWAMQWVFAKAYHMIAANTLCVFARKLETISIIAFNRVTKLQKVCNKILNIKGHQTHNISFPRLKCLQNVLLLQWKAL